jgi:hypothetical protein
MKNKNKATVCLYCGAPTILGDSVDQPDDSISGKKMYKILRKNYKKKDLLWVKNSAWIGPVEVEIKDISFAGSDEWDATKPHGAATVNKFVKLLSDKGFANVHPIILASTPTDGLLTIVNGRHRVIAAKQVGVPILAYIAHIAGEVPYIPTKDR